MATLHPTPADPSWGMLFGSNPHPMWIHDRETLAFLAVNDAAVARFGWSRDELLRMTIEDLRERGDGAPPREPAGARRSGPARLRARDGASFEADLVTHAVTYADRPAEVVLVSEAPGPRESWQQLRERQASRLESLGRLVGGLAHDYNNLLTVILGYAEMLRPALATNAEDRRALEEIAAAGARARDLTGQLLAFARRAPRPPRVIDLNDVARDVERLLRRMFAEHMAIELRLADGLWPVLADPGPIEQALVHLLLNVRDAVSARARIALETANVEDDPLGGPRVSLSVRDVDGVLDADAWQRLSGLAPAEDATVTVEGLVRQCGGTVRLHASDHGPVALDVLLPRAETREPREPAAPQPAREHATVLVIEDDADVRSLLARSLARAGHRAWVAATPDEAMALAERLPRLDLVIADVVLPGANGQETAKALVARWPGARVLLMSGYAPQIANRAGGADPGEPFLAKPFTPSVLLDKVRSALAAPARR